MAPACGVVSASPPKEVRIGSGEAHEIYVARQPILDEKQNLFGYELLFRSGQRNICDAVDPTEATSRVIINSYLTIGMDRLTGDRMAFINFDRAMLVSRYGAILPKKSLVVEVLESVEPDADVVAACRELKQSGHLLALDDVVREHGRESLVELADIVKVDFQLTTADAQARLARKYGSLGIRMLAEKVETHEQFQAALGMGYTLFQGYFFSRPGVITAKEVPGFKRNYLRILQEISHPDLDFERVEDIVKYEVQLVHRLLRYVNSANFGWKGEIHSIRHAIALLGENEFRKWISLVLLCGLAHDKASQVVVNAVVRGRFCEQISTYVGLPRRKSEFFLMGMFSLLDALLDQPMERVLDGVHLAEDVKETLLGNKGAAPGFTEALELARAWEAPDWPAMEGAAKKMGVPFSGVSAAYLDAVALADRVFHS